MIDNRYALFCWNGGERKGGWNDLVGIYQSRHVVVHSVIGQHDQYGLSYLLSGHVVDLHARSRVMEIINGYWCVQAQTTIFVGPQKSKTEEYSRVIHIPLESLNGDLSHDFGNAFLWGQNKQAATLPFKLNRGLPSIGVGDRIYMWGFAGTVPANGDKTLYIPCGGRAEKS